MWKIFLLSMNAPGIYGRSQILPGSRKWGFPGSTAARVYVKLPAFADQPAKKRGLSFPQRIENGDPYNLRAASLTLCHRPVISNPYKTAFLRSH